MSRSDVLSAIVAGACGVGVGIWLTLTGSPLALLLLAPSGLYYGVLRLIAPRIEARRRLRRVREAHALPSARVVRRRQ